MQTRFEIQDPDRAVLIFGSQITQWMAVDNFRRLSAVWAQQVGSLLGTLHSISEANIGSFSRVQKPPEVSVDRVPILPHFRNKHQTFGVLNIYSFILEITMDVKNS